MPKRSFDAFDRAKFREFRYYLRTLATKETICNKLTEMLCSTDVRKSFLANDFLEYHDHHFLPSIKDLLEVADMVLDKSLDSKIDEEAC